MAAQVQGPPQATKSGKTLPRAAVLSFTLGLIALRICWLPGINCALALAALVLGVVAFVQILRGHGAVGGIEEALTGVVLGVVVFGLSMFFVSAFIAAYR